MLLMVLLEKTSLLQRRISLTLELEEASDDLANVADILAVLPLVELELIFKQVVLLLEDCDSSQGVG